jgi:hypothetical protein
MANRRPAKPSAKTTVADCATAKSSAASAEPATRRGVIREKRHKRQCHSTDYKKPLHFALLALLIPV